MMEIAKAIAFPTAGCLGEKIQNSVQTQLRMLLDVNHFAAEQGNFSQVIERGKELQKLSEDVSPIVAEICRNKWEYKPDASDSAQLIKNLAFLFSGATHEFDDPVREFLSAAAGKIHMTQNGVYKVSTYKSGPISFFDNTTVGPIFGAPYFFSNFWINPHLARLWAILTYEQKKREDDEGGLVRTCLDQISAINIYIVQRIDDYLDEKPNAWLTAVRHDLVALRDKLITYRRNVLGVLKDIHLSPHISLGEVLHFFQHIGGVQSICDYQTACLIPEWNHDEKAIWLLLAAATGMDLTIETKGKTYTDRRGGLEKVTINLGHIKVYQALRELIVLDAYQALSNYLAKSNPEEEYDV